MICSVSTNTKRKKCDKLRLSVHDISCDVQGKKRLPHISVVKKLLLCVHQFIATLGSELQDRVFHNSIHRASFLAVSTVDTSGSVQIVASRSSQTIRTNFSLDVDNLGRTNCLTQSAGNASTIHQTIAQITSLLHWDIYEGSARLSF